MSPHCKLSALLSMSQSSRKEDRPSFTSSWFHRATKTQADTVWRSHGRKVGGDLTWGGCRSTWGGCRSSSFSFSVPPPSRIIAPPMFHPFPSLLFFLSPVKFIKEVWGTTVSFAQSELSMGWVDPWVGLGWVEIFQYLVGSVHYSKSTKNLKGLL